MKITTKPIITYSYKKPLIENGRCNLCLGYNVKDGFCIDCQREDETLYYSMRYITKKTHEVVLRFPLSEKQLEASNFFLSHLESKKDAFLNAVCGSGKTEIMYETIKKALNDGMKVAFAIPRKEIVRELYDRLKKVFIYTSIKYIDGETHDDDCDLLLTTVNQLVHYEDEFDLLILDEADAFPYSDSDYLKRVLKKSIKSDGCFFSMSATSKERPKCDTYTMNRRYHGFDLSMPVIIRQYTDDYSKIPQLEKILSDRDRRFIIYVPTIKKAKILSEYLKCNYVSSKSNNNEDALFMFKHGDERILVSTTLLERGITVKNLDVIILDADDHVFTKETIIQICGRVGRSYDDPKGNIYIFRRGNSFKFYSVKRYISRMNENEMRNLQETASGRN